MKIKVSKIAPPGYVAITLWPFGIYFSKDIYMQSKRILNHEMIHWYQQKEIALIGIIISLIVGISLIVAGIFSWWMLLLLLSPFLFYPLYFIEWIIRVITPPWDTAYKDVTFEREAKRNDRDFNYLETRKRFAWIRYL